MPFALFVAKAMDAKASIGPCTPYSCPFMFSVACDEAYSGFFSSIIDGSVIGPCPSGSVEAVRMGEMGSIICRGGEGVR